METTNANSAIGTIAVVGNHLPRHCGIATFTTDLAAAIGSEFPAIDCFVLAMTDVGRHYAYPSRVRFEIAQESLASYRRAADFLNVNGVDVVCVQHEYGIFGGKAGVHLLPLLRELRMPVVTTLHTILSKPDNNHRAVMAELVQLSERLVVMSHHSRSLLSSSYGVSESKIDVIPHGIPVPAAGYSSKNQLGVEGKSVILTFGLLSPDKGIEYMIDALPSVVERFPNTIYIVLGATHPHVVERHGETYRLSLESRAQRLGVDANIVFHDRFVTQNELNEFLAAADVYVTPYLNPEQATSGTLAYAVGAGKPVISTGYPHARELLADERGVVVGTRDAPAIAKALIDLLENDEKRHAMGKRAAAYGSQMTWPKIAARYHESFSRARSEHAERRHASYQTKPLAKRPAELPDVNLEHVRALTDSTGILQHAQFNVPSYQEGYCLDDNARALLLMALIEDVGSDRDPVIRSLASRYLAFVGHAFNRETGRFRNFMNYERAWMEDAGSEDSHARAVWALGVVVGRSRDPGRQSLSGMLFQRALGKLTTFSSPRAWAFGILGIEEYLRAFEGDSAVQSVHDELAVRLFELFRRTSTDSWPWFEDQVTYENARLSQALIAAGSWMNHEAMKNAGLQSLEWLLSIQRSKDEYFAPIGSNGFYSRGGVRAEFDQQPVDAWATIAACLEARRATDNQQQWLNQARLAFGWFLGRNHLQQPLYDAVTGGCRDGLHADRPNENQGAESTLAFQLAAVEMRSVQPAPAVRLVAQSQG
jgi:glycosyltransferase involved in cell wall biosynthesis